VYIEAVPVRELCSAPAAGSTRGRLGGLVGALCLALGSCAVNDTVDLGTYEGVRDVQLDQAYFYCHVQPQVVTAHKCTDDGSGGCHATSTPMRLAVVSAPAGCAADGSSLGNPTDAERQNYNAMQLRASSDPDSSLLLQRPTGTSHALIFSFTSPEADILRTWMRGP
jgi:hypothetical protein